MTIRPGRIGGHYGAGDPAVPRWAQWGGRAARADEVR
jgi:hypothetical protein